MKSYLLKRKPVVRSYNLGGEKKKQKNRKQDKFFKYSIRENGKCRTLLVFCVCEHKTDVKEVLHDILYLILQDIKKNQTDSY